MRCPVCSARLAKKATFCGECGTPVQRVETGGKGLFGRKETFEQTGVAASPIDSWLNPAQPGRMAPQTNSYPGSPQFAEVPVASETRGLGIEDLFGPVDAPVTSSAIPEVAAVSSVSGERIDSTCQVCGTGMTRYDLFCPGCGAVNERSVPAGEDDYSGTEAAGVVNWEPAEANDESEQVEQGEQTPVESTPEPFWIAPTQESTDPGIVEEIPAEFSEALGFSIVSNEAEVLAEPEPGVEAPAAMPYVSGSPFAEIPDLPSIDSTADQTVVVRGAVAPTYVINFSNGQSVAVATSALLGRNPNLANGEFFDQFVVVSDPTRTVSKVHLALQVTDGKLFGIDRNSANGTIVLRGDNEFSLNPGEQFELFPGDNLLLGDQSATVA